MDTVKQYIISTEYRHRQENYKNSPKTTTVQTQKIDVSVIRFSLQFGETELRRGKYTSNTRKAETEKQGKVERVTNPMRKERKSTILININI